MSDPTPITPPAPAALVEVAAPPAAARRRASDDHLPSFPGAGGDARLRLRGCSVLVVGAGSVGARIVLHLARLGVGEIGIVDPAAYRGNLQTQPILPTDVGRLKAPTIAARAKAVAPDTRVRACCGLLQALPEIALDSFDLICAATDNLTAEIELGRRSHALGRPVILGSVHGPTLTAQVRVVLNREGGPCIGCGFDATEWRRLHEGEGTFSCSPDQSPLAGDTARPPGPPTMSISPLCALAADLVVLEAVRMVLSLGAPAVDRLIEHNAYTSETITAPLARNPQCPCPHRRSVRATVPPPLAARTLRECAAAVGLVDEGSLQRAGFGVDEMVFAPRIVCSRCGAERRHAAFADPRHPVLARCRGCDEQTPHAPHPFHALPLATGDRLGARLDRPLAELGAGRARWMTVHGERLTALVREQEQGDTP